MATSDNPSTSGRCYKSWWIFFFVTLVVGGLGLSIVLILYLVAGPFPRNFGIIFDCGSSHSEMFVYSWNGKDHIGTSDAKQVNSCATHGGGISDFERTDPTAAGQSLVECLDVATKIIPERRQPSAPLFLGSTAGMRLVDRRSQEASNQIFASIEKTAKSYPFDFRYAKIISGTEEGAYGWVTANYLAERFAKDNETRKRTKTVGALDLGGASTQITFEPVPATRLPAEYTQRLVLFGQTYDIYSYSFLCYGTNEAKRMQRATLIKDAGYNTRSRIEDPCMPAGSNSTISVSDIFFEPCVQKPSFFAQLPQSYDFVGTAEPARCEQAVRALQNKSACGVHSPCSFNGAYLPESNADEFMAMSAYFYAMEFFNATNTTLVPLRALRETVDNHCRLPWDEVRRRYYNEKSAQFIHDYCFVVYHAISLLTYGYGFNESSWNRLQFVYKINGTAVGWTLGLIMNVTGQLPADWPVKHISTPLFSGLAALFAVFLVLAIFALVVALARCFIWETARRRRAAAAGHSQSGQAAAMGGGAAGQKGSKHAVVIQMQE